MVWRKKNPGTLFSKLGIGRPKLTPQFEKKSLRIEKSLQYKLKEQLVWVHMVNSKIPCEGLEFHMNTPSFFVFYPLPRLL